MDAFTRADLKELVSSSRKPGLSLFMPTNPTGAEHDKEQIKLKNLIDKAKERLKENYGMRTNEVEKFLEPIRALHEDPKSYQQQGYGIAIFRDTENCRIYQLPIEVEETLVLGDRFEIKPLLPMITEDGRFFVVSLSLDDIRLIEATHFAEREIELKDKPPSLRHIMTVEEEAEWGMQFHTQRRVTAQSGKGAIKFHGTGTDTDDSRHQAKIEEYLHRADSSLHEHLRNDKAPIVIAGVKYLAAMFQKVSKHEPIVDEVIEGHPDRWAPKELRERAWDIVKPRIESTRREATDALQQLAGQSDERVKTDPESIVTAARRGQIQTLFVERSSRLWGRFSADDGRVEVHDQKGDGDQDLLDIAAAETIAHGGATYLVEKDEMPNGAAAAAVCRYALSD
ncbi:MAG: hypothetical protein ACF8PN_10155 [Phycisphaerales bacterium]